MLEHLKLNIQLTAPGEIPEGAKRVTNEMLDELIEQDKKEGEKKWKEHKATLKNKFVIDKSIKQRFQVGCYESTDWESIHELLLKDGTLEDNIPSDHIDCCDKKEHSPTRATYMLTLDEADEIRKHSKVKFVNPDWDYYEGTFKEDPSQFICLDRYDSLKKSYRDLEYTLYLTFETGSAQFYYESNVLERELDRSGYQVGRSTQKTTPYTPNSDTTPLESKIDYSGDGTDVDLIVADTPAWFGHPEFNNTANGGPQLYQGGNVLPGNGTCDLLDVVMDAPYWIDPAWFNADSNNRLMTRWDGTRVPVESWARKWWIDASQRSSQFASSGVVVSPHLLETDDNKYTRAWNNGSNSAYPEQLTDSFNNEHGNECCAQAFGRTQGWAFNANKWFICNMGTNDTGWEAYFDIIKLFHQLKPINTTYGNKNPTVSSNSWGIRQTMSGFFWGYYRPTALDGSDYSETWGGDGTRHAQGMTPQQHHLFGALKTPGWINPGYRYLDTDDNTWKIGDIDGDRFHMECRASSMLEAADEAVASGIIFCVAAGNGAQKMVESDHPDYNNYFALPKKSGGTHGGPGGIDPEDGSVWSGTISNSDNKQGANTSLADAWHENYIYDLGSWTGVSLSWNQTTSRRGFPCQIGAYTQNGKVQYPVIAVGALDANTDPIAGEVSMQDNKERKRFYSARGNSVDCFAPGHGTLAAKGTDRLWLTGSWNNARQVDNNWFRSDTYSGLSKNAVDGPFSGTSSACPTAAGIIATRLQWNRTWNWQDVKNWISTCGTQSESDFYTGGEMTSADWDRIGDIIDNEGTPGANPWARKMDPAVYHTSLWTHSWQLEGASPIVLWQAPTANDGGGGQPPDPVYGCTDPNANNYDPNATDDDGSCTYTTSDWFVDWEKWTPQTAWVKASEGASGWYLTDPQGWSQFMKDYAMFPSNTNPLPDQDHTATWRFNLPGQPGDYTLECQCDGRATFVWDTEETLGTITSGALPIGPHNTSTNFGVSTTSHRDHWITATINNIGGGSVWNMNPGGVAWILKDARNGLPTFGDIVARSSDSFPQNPSGAWGSFMNTYAVFPSTTDPLVGQTIETTYVFTHEGGQVILEVAADGEATFLIDDVIVGSTSNPLTSDIITVGGSGFGNSLISSFQNGVPAGNRKLTVRINNTSATSFPNTWPANPGGVAFVATNASGTVLKTSLNIGQQPTPTQTTQVLGCTDPNATNYDPNANVDDGSCTYGPISGCTDPNATNYNPNATIDDGSCVYAPGGNNNLEQKDVLNTVHFPVMSNVKFSQLRNTFRDKNPSGTIKASELRRRTSKTNMDPVVPDSTENTPIATTVNWKVSQFQNSRKYYMIETSGTSSSTVNIESLAWNSNFNKNIRKWYYIKHDCESLNPNQPALRINSEVVNFTLDLQADVHGAGGLRGGEVPSSSSFNWPNSNTNGGPGGNAVQMTPTGNSNNYGVWLRSNSELFAGGGGGGRGELGTAGPDGVCYSPRVTGGNFSNGWGEWYSYRRGNGSRTWGCQCEWYIGCGNVADYNNPLTINDPGGYLDGTVYATQTHDSDGDGVGDSHGIGSGTYRSHRSNGGCRCFIFCRKTCIGDAFCAIDDPVQKPGAPGGNGGYGGLGQGGNQNRETNGRTGDAGTAKNCPTYATVGNTGGTGGAGGNWGQGGTPGGRYWIPANDYGRTPGLVPGGNWTTIFGPGYTVSPVNRVREVLATGVFTFTYLNTDEGTNTTGNTLVSGNRRYTKGNLVVNTGVAKIYQIKVEQSDGGGAGGPAGRAIQGTGYGVAGSTGNIRGGY